MIFTQMIDINKMLKVTQGQGHKVKYQGQIKGKSVKKLVSTIYTEQASNLDDAFYDGKY